MELLIKLGFLSSSCAKPIVMLYNFERGYHSPLPRVFRKSSFPFIYSTPIAFRLQGDLGKAAAG